MPMRYLVTVPSWLASGWKLVARVINLVITGLELFGTPDTRLKVNLIWLLLLLLSHFSLVGLCATP